jgi:hypothetical protein
MKITLGKSPTNLSGETLRNAVFNQKGGKLVGCCDTYELNNNFSKFNSIVYDLYNQKNIVIKACFELLENDEQWKIGNDKEFWNDYNVQAFENYEFIVMWYWDGDGTLLIYSKEEKIAFLNDDCKKDYTWKKWLFLNRVDSYVWLIL